MITACESHAKAPPVRDAIHAETVARHILKRYPSLVPEIMWDTSYPEGSGCCAHGAYAYSLMHAAFRKILG